PTTISFFVQDVETAANDLTVSAISSDRRLLPASGLILGGSGSYRTLTIMPANNVAGTAFIEVSARDDGTSNNITAQTIAAIVNPSALSPTPQLRVQLFGAQAILSWPASDAEFAIESADSLSASHWNLVTDPVLRMADQVYLFVLASERNRFFRLRK